MRLQGAIFDMDGTLLNSMPMWRNMGDNFLKSRGMEPRENIWKDIRPLTLSDMAVYYKKAYDFPESPGELRHMMEAQIEDFYKNQVSAKPGVEKFLSLLKMDGVKMYIATATARDLTEAGLKHAGIDDYFKGIVTCAEAGENKKESAIVFERALKRLNCDKNHTIVFEDSLAAIRTAKNAGFRVAGVYETEWDAEQNEIRGLSDYYIRSFEDFYQEFKRD